MDIETRIEVLFYVLTFGHRSDEVRRRRTLALFDGCHPDIRTSRGSSPAPARTEHADVEWLALLTDVITGRANSSISRQSPDWPRLEGKQ